MITRKNRGFSLIEFLVCATLVLLLAGILFGKGCANLSHGTGQKIGQVVKFSKQGLFNDTWEGQLIRGGLSDGSGAIGTQPFNFTVEDEDLVAMVSKCMEEQTEVVIDYTIEGLYSPFRSESGGNFLTNIKPAKKPPQKK